MRSRMAQEAEDFERRNAAVTAATADEAAAASPNAEEAPAASGSEADRPEVDDSAMVSEQPVPVSCVDSLSGDESADEHGTSSVAATPPASYRNYVDCNEQMEIESPGSAGAEGIAWVQQRGQLKMVMQFNSRARARSGLPDQGSVERERSPHSRRAFAEASADANAASK